MRTCEKSLVTGFGHKVQGKSSPLWYAQFRYWAFTDFTGAVHDQAKLVPIQNNKMMKGSLLEARTSTANAKEDSLRESKRNENKTDGPQH